MCSEFDVVLSKGILQTRIKLYETSGSHDDIEKKKKLKSSRLCRSVYWYIVTGVTFELSAYTFTAAKKLPTKNRLLHNIFHYFISQKILCSILISPNNLEFKAHTKFKIM